MSDLANTLTFPGFITSPLLSKPGSTRPFLPDLGEIRLKAREHIMKDAVTSSYDGDIDETVEILTHALASELVAVLRYRKHFYEAEGIHPQTVAAKFLAHSNEEMTHVDHLAKRIRQLGGHPDFNPKGIESRGHATYEEGKTLIQMIRQDLIAERVAVDIYREMIRYFANHDSITRRILKEILEQKEEHAQEMATLLATIDPSRKPATDEEPVEQESIESRPASP